MNTPDPAEYETLASMLREVERRMATLQFKVAKRATGPAVRHALQAARDGLAAASHQAQRIR